MVSKPKAKTPATPATNPVSAPLATNPVSAPPATNPVSAPPATTPATATTPAPATTFSSLATGAEYESAVNNLIEMGFPRDQVVAAMRAAFNNPDRAAEYLMTVFFY